MYQQHISTTHSGTTRILVHPATLLYRRSAAQRIALRSHQGVRYVHAQEVLYCKAESNYCHVVLEGGERIFVSKTLKWMEARLAEAPFIRPHASWLINTERVSSLHQGSVMLEDGTRVPVSRGRRGEVRRRLE